MQVEGGEEEATKREKKEKITGRGVTQGKRPIYGWDAFLFAVAVRGSSPGPLCLFRVFPLSHNPLPV